MASDTSIVTNGEKFLIQIKPKSKIKTLFTIIITIYKFMTVKGDKTILSREIISILEINLFD